MRKRPLGIGDCMCNGTEAESALRSQRTKKKIGVTGLQSVKGLVPRVAGEAGGARFGLPGNWLFYNLGRTKQDTMIVSL